jgi:hypothetical protein
MVDAITTSGIKGMEEASDNKKAAADKFKQTAGQDAESQRVSSVAGASLSTVQTLLQKAEQATLK